MLVLQAAGPAEGVVGVSGGVAGSGFGAEGGAECLPTGADSTGGGAQCPEGNQPEPGSQQRPPHQPVPGITPLHTHSYTLADTHKCFVFKLQVDHLHAKKGFSASQRRHSDTLPSSNKETNLFKALLDN